MGFLEKKERILDFVLTDRGRELLSKNQLNFKFYAFSDEGFIYSGSLSGALATSSSFDDYVHKNLQFEATQRTNSGGSRLNKDLSSFLYTIPNANKTLPTFTLGIDDTVPVVVERDYIIKTMEELPASINLNPIDVITLVEAKKNVVSNMEAYVADQRLANVRSFSK